VASSPQTMMCSCHGVDKLFVKTSIYSDSTCSYKALWKIFLSS